MTQIRNFKLNALRTSNKIYYSLIDQVYPVNVVLLEIELLEKDASS